VLDKTTSALNSVGLADERLRAANRCGNASVWYDHPMGFAWLAPQVKA
jgi:hypothetical protein